MPVVRDFNRKILQFLLEELKSGNANATTPGGNEIWIKAATDDRFEKRDYKTIRDRFRLKVWIEESPDVAELSAEDVELLAKSVKLPKRKADRKAAKTGEDEKSEELIDGTVAAAAAAFPKQQKAPKSGPNRKALVDVKNKTGCDCAVVLLAERRNEIEMLREENHRLKKVVEEMSAAHDQTRQDQEQKRLEKFNEQLEEFNEQLEQFKNAKQQAEKAKNALQLEKSELFNELRTTQAAKQEMKIRREQVESQLAEALMKLGELEKNKFESTEGMVKIQTELQATVKQWEATVHKTTLLSKKVDGLESQLAAAQDSLRKETRDKLLAQSKLRSLESDNNMLKEQLEEAEERKKTYERQMAILQQEYTEAKKKSEDVFVEQLEDFKRKSQKESATLQKQLHESEANRERVEKSKKKLQLALDGAVAELNKVRTDFCELEKRQNKFDQRLQEEKIKCSKIEEERDGARRDIRDRDAKVLGMTKELEDVRARLEDTEREKRLVQAELEELLSSKDDVGKNVHELEKAKRALLEQLEEQRVKSEELEDALQEAESAKERVDVNYNALKAETERALQLKEVEAEEKRRQLLKKVRDLEEEVENEKRSKGGAANAKKKLDAQVQDLQQQLDSTNRLKEDYLKQLRNFSAQQKEYQRDAEEAKQARKESSSALREAEKRCHVQELELGTLQDQLDAAIVGRRQIEAEAKKSKERVGADYNALKVALRDKEKRIYILELELRTLQDQLKVTNL